MEIPYTPPQLNKSSFNCPHCKAFSSMSWSNTWTRNTHHIEGLEVSHCGHCQQYSAWVNGIMVFPGQIDVESPNKDLSEEIKIDYLEAASILNQSPRGSSALLRLAIEKLVNELDAKGKDLNAKIGDLVSKGLSPKIQKALDVVRFIGNEAVHPGQIDLNDSPEIAQALFKLVNVIADEMITKPKDIDSLYDELVPETHKNGINKRDTQQ
jgi:transcription elongation factor Elf1